MASRLLATEELTAKEAVAYIKAPREGRGYQPMMRPWRSSEEPRAKRPRAAPVPENRATEGTESLGLNLMPFTKTYGLGSMIPYADWSRVKYNSTGIYRVANLVNLDKLIPFSGSLTAEALKLIKAALSRNTWAKYSSAWNAFAKFENTVGKNFSWPLEDDAIRGFAT